MLKLSSKQKQEVYSVSNLILHLAIFIILLLTLNSCTETEVLPNPEEQANTEKPTETGCGTLATVRDLRGLDGCGFVFELANGEKLEPIIPSGTSDQQNPLKDFNFVDGQQVTIGYQVQNDAVSICMVGEVVKITCISKVNAPEAN